MISAPNHRQRLSGSRIVASVLLVAAVFSCKAPKQVSGKPPAPPTPPVIAQEDKVKQYDPVKDSVVLIPRDALKVDTVKWTEDTTPPIVTDEVGKPDKPEKGYSEIALLMPFNASNAGLFSERKDPKLNRFLQYYAGMKMAIDHIDPYQTLVKIKSFDIDNPATSLSMITSGKDFKTADVIVGPYEKEGVEAIASFGLANEIMVVSPWLPAFTTNAVNPYLIQLLPGLSTHAEAITDYIRDEMPGKKVYVVVRDTPIERNRVQLFSKTMSIQPEELVIKDASPDLVNTDLHRLLSDDAGTIFILPFYAKTDETFVNSFMRKLHADKDTREAIVFGLPQWVGYNNLNANYMESLSLHMSISTFVDVASPEYPAFKKDFFNRYHTIPDLNAFLGYDLMTWLVHALDKNGQEGLIGQMNQSQYGLASGFDIQPVYNQTETNKGEMNTPLYYENRRIRIVRFVDQDFILAR